METLSALITIALIWLGWNWNKYVFDKKRDDVPGFIEWMKAKYLNKSK